MNMKFSKVMENAEKRLLSLGYSPKRCYDDQLDCRINGISFAIYGSEEDESFGFGCVFEPAEDAYADGFFEEVEAGFCGRYAPFQSFLLCDDGTLHLEGESDTYTDSLIDAVVFALLSDEGIAATVKARSYVGEDN